MYNNFKSSFNWLTTKMFFYMRVSTGWKTSNILLTTCTIISAYIDDKYLIIINNKRLIYLKYIPLNWLDCSKTKERVTEVWLLLSPGKNSGDDIVVAAIVVVVVVVVVVVLASSSAAAVVVVVDDDDDDVRSFSLLLFSSSLSISADDISFMIYIDIFSCYNYTQYG